MKSMPQSLLSAAGALLLGMPATAQDYHSNDVTPAGAGSGKLTAAISGNQVGGFQPAGSYAPRAVLLTGNAVTGVDLHPVNAYQSLANGQLQVTQLFIPSGEARTRVRASLFSLQRPDVTILLQYECRHRAC